MDTTVINALIDVLTQEAKVYDDILRISKNKTGIIIEGKVSELENLVKLEQALILQMGRLETMRENLVEKLSKQFNLDTSAITVSELLKHLKDEQADKLKACQDNIVNTVNELKNTNDVNSKLIRNSLDYIDFSINIIGSADNGTNNYGNTGQVSTPGKRNFFDMKL